MSDLARLPSYPSPTTLIARSGIQFLDFGFDATKLRVREWGFHDAAAAKSVDELVSCIENDDTYGVQRCGAQTARRSDDAMCR